MCRMNEACGLGWTRGVFWCLVWFLRWHWWVEWSSGWWARCQCWYWWAFYSPLVRLLVWSSVFCTGVTGGWLWKMEESWRVLRQPWRVLSGLGSSPLLPCWAYQKKELCDMSPGLLYHLAFCLWLVSLSLTCKLQFTLSWCSISCF